MSTDWASGIPAFVLFIIGLGALAAAVLHIVRLYRAMVPDREIQLQKDIGTIKADLHDIRTRVGMLEIEVAKIDQPAITKRFDSIETKIDRLYAFLIDRFASPGGRIDRP